MDEETGSALQQLADDRLNGRLRDHVEQLRRDGGDGRPMGWREIATKLSEKTRLGIGKSTLHRWAEEGGWDVGPVGSDRQAS